MNATILDFLRNCADGEVTLRSGNDLLQRCIRMITSDLSETGYGIIYVIKDPWIDIEKFMDTHPNAAGILLKQGLTAPDRSEMPVLMCEHPEVIQRKWEACITRDDSVCRMYELLQQAGDEETMLQQIADSLGCRVFAANGQGTIIIQSKEPFDRVPEGGNQCRRSILYHGSPVYLAAYDAKKQIDRFRFECWAAALRCALLNQEESLEIMRREIASLIMEGRYKLVRAWAKKNRIDLSGNPVIWLLHGNRETNLNTWLHSILELCDSFGKICFYGGDETNFILVLKNMGDQAAELKNAAILADYMKAGQIPFTLIHGISFSKPVPILNELCEKMDTALRDAGKIFPGRSCFSIEELITVISCRKLVDEGGTQLEYYRMYLDRLRENGDEEIMNTLAVFLIDERMSTADTAAHLFVHRNTIKYRLQKAEDILGFELGDVISLQYLICALCIYRLER